MAGAAGGVEDVIEQVVAFVQIRGVAGLGPVPGIGRGDQVVQLGAIEVATRYQRGINRQIVNLVSQRVGGRNVLGGGIPVERFLDLQGNARVRRVALGHIQLVVV